MELKDASRIYGPLIKGRGYKDAEEYIVFNEDPDLKPIPVYLPKPPDWHLIDGFGQDAVEQKWHRPKMPKKLHLLVTTKKLNGEYMSIDEVWETLEVKQEEYAEEIIWIEKQWYHRLYGYWFFNHGVPTYITGDHYLYVSFANIDTGYPRYRNRDRKYYVFCDFCEKDTYDFKHKDEHGNAVSKDGWYEMFDTGARVCFGHVYPKMRREGATYREIERNLNRISVTIEANGGIQSRNEDDGRKVFRKLMRMYKVFPFFFKPYTASKTDAAKILLFDLPNRSASGAVVDVGLQSMISFEDGDPGAYDGDKLYFKHDDEEGKNKDNDIVRKNMINKECLSLAAGEMIIGYNAKTSTAGEMEAGGGEQFFKVCEDSNFFCRPSNGQTLSGVYRLFIISEDGLINDEYGNSIIEDPKKPIRREDGRMSSVGSRSWIENKAEAYLLKNDIEGWSETRRLYPQRYTDCFSTKGSEIGFNKKILTTRLSELRMRPATIKGNLIRLNPNDRFSKIKFEEDPLGRFSISKILADFEANKFHMGQDGQWFPGNAKKYNAGVDPFKFNQTENNEMSDGGISVKWKHDEALDPLGKPISQWESDRFVLTYRFRPASKEEFSDDVLKICLYFGCPVLSESQIPDVQDDFIEWNARPFLKVLKDTKGYYRTTPGVHAGENSKDSGFKLVRDYIDRRGKWENHEDFLKECKEIPSIKKLNKYDLLAACTWALVSEKSDFGEWMEPVEEEEYNIDDFVIRYN